MSLKTPSSVQCLQQALARRSKSEPEKRFYSLYDKVYRDDVLWAAWQRVKANGGSCGVDSVTIAQIVKSGEGEFLATISKELKSKRYSPKALRRHYILKQNGKKRPLGIPTLKDRVVQQAVRLVIEPVFEAHFSEASYGFRPGRSCHGAVEEVKKFLQWGLTTVIETDIVDCFGSIPHGELMKKVAERISDKKILRLIKSWLKCGVMENGRIRSTIAGTPQGGVISPLLANIYLNALDQKWKERKMDNRWGHDAHLVRYADDMVILTGKGPKEPFRLLKETLEAAGLTMHPEKTRIVDAKTGNFDFLGFNFRKVKNPRSGKVFALVQPFQKAQKALREKIREKTGPNTRLKLGELIKTVNPIIRGWVNYFRIGNSSKAFGKARRYVADRTRRYRRRQQNKNGYGWKELKDGFLYKEMGLFNNYRTVWNCQPVKSQ